MSTYSTNDHVLQKSMRTASTTTTTNTNSTTNNHTQIAPRSETVDTVSTSRSRSLGTTESLFTEGQVPRASVTAQCYNCHTTMTPLWKKDDKGKPVCNEDLYHCIVGVVICCSETSAEGEKDTWTLWKVRKKGQHWRQRVFPSLCDRRSRGPYFLLFTYWICALCTRARTQQPEKTSARWLLWKLLPARADLLRPPPCMCPHYTKFAVWKASHLWSSSKQPAISSHL